MFRLATIAVFLAGPLSNEAHSARLGGISLGYQGSPPIMVDESLPRPRRIDAESIRIANQLSMELYGGLPGAARPLLLSGVPAAPNSLPLYQTPGHSPLQLPGMSIR